MQAVCYRVAMLAAVLSLAMLLVCSPCLAMTRWCSFLGKGAKDTLLYPPIARAAYVHGLTIGRINFMPSGQVLGLEAISGPVMLTRAVNDQMKAWTIRTDATGSEACQSLVVAEFTIGDRQIPSPLGTPLASVYRISVHAEELIISDPAFTITRRRRFRFW